MKIYWAVILCVIALGSPLASALPNQVSFCQRYANALFGPLTPSATIPDPGWTAAEESFIAAVVNRGLNGVNASLSATGVAVTGIFNSTLQRPFFTTPIDYYNNTVARNSLTTHFKVFFINLFNCWDVPSNNSLPSNMGAVHQGMNITAEIWYDFVQTFQSALASFGVSNADLNYTAVLFRQFAHGSGVNQICNFAADCPTYTSIEAFASGVNAENPPVRSFVNEHQPFDSNHDNATINAGDWIHWDLSPSDSIFQTATASENDRTPISGGRGGPSPSVTLQFPTAGTYYFHSTDPSHPSMISTVIVNGTIPADSSSSSSISSTGADSNTNSSSSTGRHNSAANMRSSPAKTLVVFLFACVLRWFV